MDTRKKTDLIVVHCSATKSHTDIGVHEIDMWHKQKGWNGIGYHYVIRRNGNVEHGRNKDAVGAHVQGHNASSVGVCMVGGVGEDLRGQDNFTDDQYESLEVLLRELKGMYPNCKIVGHRDLSPDLNKDGVITKNEWFKECPSFEVKEFLKKRGI